MASRINRPKTRRGKRHLEERAPKVIENDKTALIIKGGKTSELVSNVLADIYALKKPFAQQLKRRNPFHLFEDEVPLEQFSTKYDASLFVFGSNSKKHPDCLIFGRLYDFHILDMVELRIENYVSSKEFSAPRVVLGAKPCIVLQGTAFESDTTMKRLGNLMVDWFRGPVVENIALQGLELVVSLTSVGDHLLFRVYRTCLKRSASTFPRVELLEIGPRIDFTLQRTKLASDSLFKLALKQPKEIKAKKAKNTSMDIFGTKLGRIHVGRQDLNSLQTRKMKALKKSPNKSASQPEDR
ncbi:unnamed protein product [Enterobius vermicularis]|uniref:Ribosome production factor 2 homolog n=1 Tax=Enterobius vermicularis TaxID=51028 RepID=A0A0N4VH56_ENTVE|nr:unnamed protein product [Enterobius vermicularis]